MEILSGQRYYAKRCRGEVMKSHLIYISSLISGLSSGNAFATDEFG